MGLRLDLLAQLLIDGGPWNGKVLAFGQNLFMNHMPDTCQEGIMIRAPLQGIPINHYIPGYYAGGKVQVIVRSAHQDIGAVLADQVLVAMTVTMQRDFLADDGSLVMRINHMLADTLPIAYPRSPGNLTEWSLNFALNYISP